MERVEKKKKGDEVDDAFSYFGRPTALCLFFPSLLTTTTAIYANIQFVCDVDSNLQYQPRCHIVQLKWQCYYSKSSCFSLHVCVVLMYKVSISIIGDNIISNNLMVHELLQYMLQPTITSKHPMYYH